MKRKILFVLLVIILTVMVSAQEQGRGNRPNRNRMPAAEKVTVSGSLIVHNGMPALKSGDDIYFVARIFRLVGFVDGLKEGAQVTIEGSSFVSQRDKTQKFLMPSKLTLNGKSYDFAPLSWNRDAPRPEWRHQPPRQAPGWGQPRHPPRFPQKQHWL